jgi:outer membrane protein
MKLKLITACLGVAVSASALAGANIGVVDMQKVAQSPLGKSASLTLQKKFSSRQKAIVKLQQKYQKDFSNLQKNKTVMTASKLKDAQKQLATEQQSLQAKESSFQQDLYAAQNKLMAEFVAKTQAAAGKVASSKHLQVVLPRKAVLYYNPDMDVTSAVLKAMK